MKLVMITAMLLVRVFILIVLSILIFSPVALSYLLIDYILTDTIWSDIDKKSYFNIWIFSLIISIYILFFHKIKK